MPKITQKCRGYEVFQRMNYLFQIRELMAANPMISTYYGNLIVNIAKKSVLRIDPNLKRQICKRCRGPLLPGQTAKVKVKRKKKTTVVSWRCLQCQFVKNYPASSNKTLWLEKPESLIEKLDYSVTRSYEDCEPKTHNSKNNETMPNKVVESSNDVKK